MFLIERLFLFGGMDMEFKEATLLDFEQAFSFIESLWDYNEYKQEDVFRVYKRVIEDENSFAFFLIDGNQYQGFCHGNYFDTFWMSGNTCYISSLITNKEQRKKGYGKAMVDHALDLAREKNCKAAILCSGMPRKEAHQFYENYGFEKGCYGFEMILD